MRSFYALLAKNMYEDISKSFWTGRLERELQMVQLSATRCSQSGEFCRHNLLFCFSSVYCCLFPYWLSPETSGYVENSRQPTVYTLSVYKIISSVHYSDRVHYMCITINWQVCEIYRRALKMKWNEMKCNKCLWKITTEMNTVKRIIQIFQPESQKSNLSCHFIAHHLTVWTVVAFHLK
jgi:hypothetical protein